VIHTRFAAILVVAACAAANVGAQAIYNPATGRHYALTPQPGDLAALRAQAQAMGGTLVSIKDAAENAFVQAHFLPVPSGEAFIGLSDEVTEGTFLWDDGSPVNYVNWFNVPDNYLGGQDAVRMISDGTWDDIEASGTGYGIVEGKVLARHGSAFQFCEDFSDNSAGWTLGTEWAIGPAIASPSGPVLHGDPGSDADGVAGGGLAGVVIGGNNAPGYHAFRWLTSPVLSCAGATNLTLTYMRYLNSAQLPAIDHQVEIYDGVNWIAIYEGGLLNILDTVWTPQSFSLAPYAGPSFRVRFGFAVYWAGPASPSWSVDNVCVFDASPPPAYLPTVGAYAPLGGGTGSLGIANVSCPPGAAAITAITFGNGNVPHGWFFGLEIPMFDLGLQIAYGAPPFVVILDAAGRSEFEILGGVPPGIPLAMVTVPVVGGAPVSWTAPVLFTTH
jgi:hypothetical protein